MTKTLIAPKYLTLRAAANYCSLSEKTLRRKITSGKLTHYRPTRAIQISIEDLDLMMSASRIEAINFDDLLAQS